MTITEIKQALKLKEREIETLKLSAEDEIYRLLQELADKFQKTIIIYAHGNDFYYGGYDEELRNALFDLEDEVSEIGLYLIHEKVFKPLGENSSKKRIKIG